MAQSRRPPRHTRPKPVKKKAARYDSRLNVNFLEDDNARKLTTPKGCRAMKGVRWTCSVCGGRWPAFVTKSGEFTHAEECRDPVDENDKRAGCPGCAPGLSDSVAASMPRYEFDPVECVDLAERGVGLKEGEFAVSWQFKYPPVKPPKVEDEDPTGMGKGVTWSQLNPNALASQHRYKAYQGPRYFAAPVRVSLTGYGGIFSDGAVESRDEEVLDAPEGRIVRRESDALYVNRRLHSRSAYSVAPGIRHLKFDGVARPRKYLRIVDHTGMKLSLDDLLDYFEADVTEVKQPPPFNGKLLGTFARGVWADAVDREHEALTPDERREIFRLIVGVEMTDDLGADLDRVELPFELLARRLKADEAFEARREVIRKDGALKDATRLFHGTCAHNIRSVLKHGLEPSTWAVNSALGPGIYLGKLPKARAFAHACDFLHFLEGFVEGERIGRRFRGKLGAQTTSLVQVNATTPSLATSKQIAVGRTLMNPASTWLNTVGSMTSLLVSVSAAHVELSKEPSVEETARFFIQQLREEFGEEAWLRLTAKKRPDQLLDIWSGSRPGRLERRWKKKDVLSRARFVFEVDVLLGNSYRITNPEDVVNNNTPRRFAFRGGCHSVYCTRFRQDEWCVYRTDQVLLKRVNMYVDNEGME